MSVARTVRKDSNRMDRINRIRGKITGLKGMEGIKEKVQRSNLISRNAKTDH